MQRKAQVGTPKLAIVGMDSCLGTCDGIDALDCIIYNGTQHFISAPSQSINGSSITRNDSALGAFIGDVEIDLLDLQVSPQVADKLAPQELLMLKVVNNALKDAGIKPRENVAAIVATAGKFSVQQLQKKWDFPGSFFTLDTAENSVFKALEVAHTQLATKEIDAVVIGAVELVSDINNIWLYNHADLNTGVNTLSYDQNVNGCTVGEGAVAVVLKLHETAKQRGDRIYAVIDAIGTLQSSSDTDFEAVTQACQQAFEIAEIQPTDIGYLEVYGCGSPQVDASEIKGLNQAYQTAKSQLNCAIGSIKANVGHNGAASGITSLIKTALCLYHRYIPATPQWSKPKYPELWQHTPFYVAPESRPWFLEPRATKRIATVNYIGTNGTYAHLVLSEASSQGDRQSRYLEQMPFYLLPLAADERSELLAQLHTLQISLADCSSVSHLASQTFAIFQQRQPATYTLAILGHHKDELSREIQRAISGVANAFERGQDWQTPVGSYFTAKPLGKQGDVAFVYPGAYSSYVGLARNLFRLFPQIYDDLAIKSVYNRVANIGKRLYPRSLTALSKRQLEKLEQQLLDDPLAMLESETGYAGLITVVLRNYFQIKPQRAFGYSLGETSMMFAQGIWTNFNQSSHALNSSSLFSNRLAGAKNAVREYWGLPTQNYEAQEIWSTYILIAAPERVREYLKHEHRVYLTQINTPKELVIAGDTQACLTLINTLKCDAFRAPFNHAIHCQAIRSEYDELVKLHALPIQTVSDVIFYSAAEYAPTTLTSEAIASNIAQVLCQQLDFPRLVNRVYEDGSRIFIEAGVGSNCSRWISENLKQQEHVTISLTRRGIDEHTSILKALAKLLSHQVSLDLSPLYGQILKNYRSNKQAIALNGSNTQTGILSKNGKQSSSREHGETESLIQFRLNNLRSEPSRLNQQKSQSNVTCSITLEKLFPKSETLNFPNFSGKQLNESAYHLTKIHASFLQTRQEGLQRISEIIRLQIACKTVHTTSFNFLEKKNRE